MLTSDSLPLFLRDVGEVAQARIAAIRACPGHTTVFVPSAMAYVCTVCYGMFEEPFEPVVVIEVTPHA